MGGHGDVWVETLRGTKKATPDSKSPRHTTEHTPKPRGATSQGLGACSTMCPGDPPSAAASPAPIPSRFRTPQPPHMPIVLELDVPQGNIIVMVFRGPQTFGHIVCLTGYECSCLPPAKTEPSTKICFC